jgi:hypothetical protein
MESSFYAFLNISALFECVEDDASLSEIIVGNAQEKVEGQIM